MVGTKKRERGRSMSVEPEAFLFPEHYSQLPQDSYNVPTEELRRRVAAAAGTSRERTAQSCSPKVLKMVLEESVYI